MGWNELNCDVNKHRYTKAAYGEGEFAFLTDYVCLDTFMNRGIFRYRHKGT